MMKETPWRFYREGGWRIKIQARYGIDYSFARRHNQAPYFSMTGTSMLQARNNRWMDHGGGAMHETIAARFPELAPLVKWHLVGTEGPSHYFDNAQYWFELAQGVREYTGIQTVNPVEAFKNTIVLGAFPGDVPPPELHADLERGSSWKRPGDLKWKGPKEWAPSGSPKRFFKGVPWEYVLAWLEERHPKLMAAWVVDMASIGVLEENP